MRIFRKALKQAALRIPFDNLAKLTYEQSINFNIPIDVIEDAYYDFYYDIGRIHGKRIGRDITKVKKNFDLSFFDRTFAPSLREFLTTRATTNIVSVRRSLVKVLLDFIQLKLEEGLTMTEVSRELHKHILSRGFYRWQIERIVRTETTAAANYGASRASHSSGILMQKEWISAIDGRTRAHERGDNYDHIDMDGVLVGPEDNFMVANKFGLVEPLEFPGDPKGSAGNIINCRCTVALIPKRDANGDLIFTSGNSSGVSLPKLPPIKPPTRIAPPKPVRVPKPISTLKDAEDRIKKLGIKKVSLKGLKDDELKQVVNIFERENAIKKIEIEALTTYNRKSKTAAFFKYGRKGNGQIRINVGEIRKEKQIIDTYQHQINKVRNKLDKMDSTHPMRKILERKVTEIERKISNGVVQKYWSISKELGGAEGVGATMTHEIGHYRHIKQLGETMNFRFSPSAAPTVYGGSNKYEYFAEWYTHYRHKGPANVPKDMLDLFKKLEL